MNVARKCEEALAIANDGHEIANHSWVHMIGLTRIKERENLLNQITLSRDHLQRAGLPEPVGFRAPGYDVDERIIDLLRELGYWYDASILPTKLSPVMRVADAVLARKIQLDKRQFGRLRYAKAPREPYNPTSNAIQVPEQSFNPDELVEFPVGTLGPLGLPLTGSLIFAKGGRSVALDLRRLALEQKSVMVLLHGIDLVDCSRPIIFPGRTPRVGGFDMSYDQKLKQLLPVVEALTEHFHVVTSRQWIEKQRSLNPQGVAP